MLQGKIENILYQTSINIKLSDIDYNLNVNNWPSRCIVKKGEILYSVSKWVSPKRTRSYPFSRVYDTFSFLGGKRITIIPIVKDEGEKGDRDFLQWATIALMSLLNVYVIIAYYEDGDKRGLKITNQKFNDDFIKDQFDKLDNYHSSALHWNLDQLNNSNLKLLMDKVIHSYNKMFIEKGVVFHNTSGLSNFQKKIGETIEEFKKFSSLKAEFAQGREIKTTHILEALGEGEKMKIVIENYLGGLYYFTIDDVVIKDEVFYLMECKHSNGGILPSDDDVKDGLLKLILFTNLDKLYFNDIETKFIPVIRLTSNKMIGFINETSTDDDVKSFVSNNKLSKSKYNFIIELITEVKNNNIKLVIEKV
jgi:hypothetical protein